MMERRISVISVNYNGYDLTCAMIDSLRRHVTTPLEIVIVDNGSTRDEAAPLRERYPDVKVLRSERNLGFAGGNNLGFAAATGDYLLLLNNDTEVTEDTLHYLRETLDNDRSIGAVCPKIRFFAPPQHIQFAGYTPLTRITLRNALIGFGEPDDGRYDTPHDTPYAHGAAIAATRATDTVKYASGGFVAETLDRNDIWLAQTPQVFRDEIYRAAAYTAEKDGFAATDDASLAEHIGIGVYLVDCGAENFKVTVGSDLSRAEILLREREEKNHAHRTGI